jgi:hypothetical protein
MRLERPGAMSGRSERGIFYNYYYYYYYYYYDYCTTTTGV